MESSDLAHLPGRGVQISRLAREASLYRPGAAPGGKEEAAPGGRRGEGPRLLAPQRPLQGPGSAAFCAVPGLTCGGAGTGAHTWRGPRGLWRSPQKNSGRCLTPPPTPQPGSGTLTEALIPRARGRAISVWERGGEMLEKVSLQSVHDPDFNRFLPLGGGKCGGLNCHLPAPLPLLFAIQCLERGPAALHEG